MVKLKNKKTGKVTELKKKKRRIKFRGKTRHA